MRERLRSCALVCCLFVFLFVLIGGGLHLTTGAAFIAALSGTPLAIFAFNRWHSVQLQREEPHREESAPGTIPLRERS